MGRRLFLLTLGAAAAAYVLSRRRAQRPPGSANGSPLSSSDAVRRAVGEVRQRIEADAEAPDR